jgi:hypothetical protein
VLRPVVIEQFPGLDLRQDPGDSRGAIDLANVTIETGRIRTRDGSSLFYTPATTPNNFYYLSPLFIDGAGNRCIIGGLDLGTANFVAIRPGTGLIASIAGALDSNGASGVAYGTPTGSRYYVASASSNRIYEWSGTAWTDVTASIPSVGGAAVLGLNPGDNRLVISVSSRVYFSNPGVALAFGANNYVDLTPGDGETVQAMYVFNNQLFVFKQSRFFVFYGTSTDSTGNPIFNYRTVDTGIGVSEAFVVSRPQSTCVGDDGIYFVGPGGIYRTTGGPPVLMSAALQPFFDFTPPTYWTGAIRSSFNAGLQRLMWLNGKLYYSTSDGIFVWDRALNSWSWWNIKAGALGSCSTTSATNSPTYLAIGGNSAGSSTITLVRPTLTTDNGTAIVSRYRLPFETYGNPAEKRIREVIVEGSGAPTLGVTADWSSTGITKALTLGTAPALNDDRMHNAWRGRAFSIQLSAASGAWAVNRVQANVADAVRPVSVTI